MNDDACTCAQIGIASFRASSPRRGRLRWGCESEIKITPSFVLPRRGEGWKRETAHANFELPFRCFYGCAVPRRRMPNPTGKSSGSGRCKRRKRKARYRFIFFKVTVSSARSHNCFKKYPEINIVATPGGAIRSRRESWRSAARTSISSMCTSPERPRPMKFLPRENLEQRARGTDSSRGHR